MPVPRPRTPPAVPSSTDPAAPASPRSVDDADRPRLVPHVRLTFDSARERHVLLAPEAVSVLNGTGAKVLELCDGRRTVTEIVEELRRRYAGVDGAEVRRFLAHLAAKRCVEFGRAAEHAGEHAGEHTGEHTGEQGAGRG
jgi:pyrroloquinoline quinone biosynthesis protein D